MFNGINLRFGDVQTVITKNLNAAPTALMYAGSFIAESTALNYFWVNIAAVAGTNSLRKVTFELQSDSAGAPSGAVLGAYEQVGGFTAAKTVTKILPSWSGVTLTIGARYWIVAKNTAVAPTVDYVGFGRAPVISLAQATTYNVVCCPWVFRTHNGTNWTATVCDPSASFFTLVYVGDLVSGARYVAITSYDAEWLMNTSRSVGTEIRIPDNSPALNVTGAALYANSAPATKLRIFRNRTLLLTSEMAANTPTAVATYITAATKFVAYPGDTISIMTEFIASSGGQVYGEVIPDDPDFLGMKIWNAKRVKVSDTGAWATDDLHVPATVLYLDPALPFIPPLINRRTSTGR